MEIKYQPHAKGKDATTKREGQASRPPAIRPMRIMKGLGKKLAHPRSHYE